MCLHLYCGFKIVWRRGRKDSVIGGILLRTPDIDCNYNLFLGTKSHSVTRPMSILPVQRSILSNENAVRLVLWESFLHSCPILETFAKVTRVGTMIVKAL